MFTGVSQLIVRYMDKLEQLEKSAPIPLLFGNAMLPTTGTCPYVKGLRSVKTERTTAQLNVLFSLLLRPDRTIFLFHEAISQAAMRSVLAPHKVKVVQGCMMSIKSLKRLFPMLSEAVLVAGMVNSSIHIQTDFYIPEQNLYTEIEGEGHFHAMFAIAMSISLHTPLYQEYLELLVIQEKTCTQEEFHENITYYGPPFFLDVLHDYDKTFKSEFDHIVNKTLTLGAAVPYNHVISQKRLKLRYLSNRSAYHKNISSRIERIYGVLSAEDQCLRNEKNGGDDMECCICLNCPAAVLFQPCGHVSACEECASNLEVCMLCRSVIVTKSVCQKKATSENVSIDDQLRELRLATPFRAKPLVSAKVHKSKRGKRRARR